MRIIAAHRFNNFEKLYLHKPLFTLGLAAAFSMMTAFFTHVTAADEAAATATDGTPSSSEFFFQNNPRPVLFYGDDATAQRMFTTLIETYTLSRFPNWDITFRNVGWEGDNILDTALRGSSRDIDIRRDIASYHPQVALVNYGMNDAQGGDAGYEYFLIRVNILSRDLPRVGVNRAAFISSNPQEGYEAGAPAGSSANVMLQKYAEGLKERVPIGWKDGVTAVLAHPKGPDVPSLQNGVFIDILNPMIALIEAGRKAGVLSADNSLGDKTVRLMPDGIHPNWSGHLIMAALILQGLQAPSLVSSATLDAAGHATTSSQGCTITWQDAPAGVVQFQRKDDALPWPTPPETDLALKIPGFDPATTLNNYELQVTGLTGASYKLSIDDQVIGTYAKTDLANGINLGFMRMGPIYDQGQKLLKAVIDKNDTFFHRWREVQLTPLPAPGTSAADMQKANAAHLDAVKPQLDQLDKTIADDEQAIKTLCQPLPHVFKLVPVGQ